MHRISRLSFAGYSGFGSRIVATIAALSIIAAASAQTPSVPVLPARTSWIGNTFGFGDGKWMQIDVSAIAVAPDGRVFTNAPWDESGEEIGVYRDGKALGPAGGTHGWGHGGGRAIALNGKYVFAAATYGNERDHLLKDGVWPPRGMTWYGVTRRQLADVRQPAGFQPVAAGNDAGNMAGNAALASAFLRINEAPTPKRGERKNQASTPDVGGLAATQTTLYVANTAMDCIELYDTESMQPKGKWDAAHPGRLAVSSDGTIWAIVNSSSDSGARPGLAHYAANGQLIGDAPALGSDTQAVDLALDSKGRLLIADNGPRQQVLIFTRDSGRKGKYRETATLGERGGIFSGVAGRPGPQRFNGLTGVGADAAGNVVVSTNGVGPDLGGTGAGLGATLESYAPDGRMLWQLQGLLFVDGAWTDPTRPDSVFTGNKRFELDDSKPAGQDWKYTGFLSDRFKYPQDPVFNLDDWPGMPMARKVDGHLFLYLADMYSSHLKIYRFDKNNGELATPAGFFSQRARDTDRIPNHPATGDWIWRDANGNGRFDTDEFEENKGRSMNPAGWGWWVDTKGDIWHTSDTRGINRFRLGGIDRAGNPVYSYSNAQNYAMPAPFNVVKRAIYEPETDSMYLTGYDANDPFDSAFWKEIGKRLVRYDHWSSAPQLRYSIELPWQTSKQPISTLISLTVEGKYIFTVESRGLMLHVYDKETGREVGTIEPGPEVGRASGWVDVPNGISASLQPNGEYRVFVEEDARGKAILYRWKP